MSDVTIRLSDLRKFAEYERIRLMDMKDGRIVASSNKGLDRYNDCEIYGIRLQLDFNREKNYAIPIIVGWVMHSDVENIRKMESNI